jgi:hypothetical protein
MKSIIGWYLCVSLLAGFGMLRLSRARHRRRAVLAGAGAALVAVVLASSSEGAPSLAWGLVSVVLLSAVLWLPGLGRRARQGAALLVLAYHLHVACPARPLTEEQFYARPALAEMMAAQGVGLHGPAFERIDGTVRPAREWPVATAAGGGGAGTALNGLWSLPSLSPALPGASLRIRELFAEHSETLAARIAGVFGVRFMVLREPLPERMRPQVIAREPRFDYALVELKRSLPRAYAVHRGRALPGREQALQALVSREFKPGREVILEAEHPDPDWARRPDMPAVVVELPEGTRSNSAVHLVAELPWPGFVVLNEAYFSGWSAFVDGVPGRVMPANYAMRAVEVPAGRHSIELRYETPGLRLGALVSAGALAVALALLVMVRKPP